MRRTGIALLALVTMGLAASSAAAGDNNEAYFIQLSPNGTLNGNTLEIYQEAASNSKVTGIGSNLVGQLPSFVLNRIGANPLLASQRGEGNTATLTLEGNGGELQLLQSSNPVGAWVPGGAAGYNEATITSDGASLGGIIQVGEFNEATMSLDDGRGLITQLGSKLTANLDVGADGSGTVIQIGSNSTVGTVQVAAGTSVTYTQIGNGLTSSVPVSVYSSNPGNITITQMAW